MSDVDRRVGDREAVGVEVLEAAQAMDAAGLVVGTAGNVSGRAADGTVCLTPSAVPYDQMTAEGLAVVDLDGTVVAGGGRPTTEKAMHLACYRAFPEVGGVVHCHPIHASMFAVVGRAIPPLIEEAILYIGGDVAVAEYRLTGSDELGEEVVRHLGERSAVLMANHGLLCVGYSPQDALHAALVTEHTAHILWGAAMLGAATPLPEAARADFAQRYVRQRAAWGRG